MKATRILSLVLALMLVFAMSNVASAATFNAEGYPIVDEKVTLRVMMTSRAEMPSDLNTQDIHKKAEEIMNVYLGQAAGDSKPKKEEGQLTES